MKVSYLLVVFTICCITSQLSAQVMLPDSVIRQLKAGVEGFQERYHSPSIVVAIIHDSDLVFTDARGYADIEKKVPATIHTKYPLLSVTKTFTATMLMQLMEQRKLNLFDPVNKYLPEFRDDAGATNRHPATLLQLATHTAGLPRNSPADIQFSKQIDTWVIKGSTVATIAPATNKEVLQSLRFVRREYPEYEFMSYSDRRYSNLGYSLLGISLERAAKIRYEAFISANICTPLNMLHTGFDTEKSGLDSLAKGYFYNDSTRNFTPTPVFRSNAALYAGGMYSTAADMAKYLRFQFRDDPAATRILSPESRAMMLSFRIGWKPSYPIVLHEGAMLGYRCQVAFDPNLKVGWVILTNTSEFEFSRFNEYIYKLLSPVFTKKATPELHKFTGTYVLEGGYDSLYISMQDGKLYSSYLGNVLPQTPLVTTGTNKFKGQGKSSYNIGYEFLTGANGEIRLLNLGQMMWVKQ